jgi:iron complex outermembrane receptor protein
MVDLFGDFDFDNAHLSTILSYHHNRGFSDRLTDASPLEITRVVIRPESDTYIAEAVLSSTAAGPLQWVAGLNFMDDDTRASPQYVNAAESHYGIATRAASAFGEVTYQFAERWFLTGGLRYSWEEKDAFNTQVSTGVTVEGNDSWSAVTPRASLRYALTDTSNIYFTYSQGFKSGSFDASGAAGAQASVDPEIADAYEIGYRGDIGASLRLGLAAFAYNYTDLQAVVINAGPGFSFSQLQNAADSEIRGFEGTLDWFATDNLQITAGVSLLSTEFTRFPNASVTVPRPQVGGEFVGNVNTVADLSGYSLIRSPEWTFNLGAEHTANLLGGELTTTVNAFFSDSYFFDINNRVEQPAYTVVNASATWRPSASSGLRFTLNGYNLTDELYFAQVFSSGNGDAAVYQRPQWFALTVGYSF